MTTPHARPGALILGSDFKALGVVRSLGRRGIPSVLIDDLPRSAWFSRYVIRRCRWNGAMWGQPFVDFVVEVARQYDLGGWVLMPLQDEVVEVVARHWAQLRGTYRMVSQPWDIVQWAHDKRLAYQRAREAGIPYPRTWYPSCEEDLDGLDVDFPAILKPAISIRLQYAIGRKALVAEDRAALRRHYRDVRTVFEPEEIMVQEIIPGDGRTQYAVGAFCADGRIVAGMTARRRRQYPLDYGMSSSLVEAIDVPELLPLARRLLYSLRLQGMVEVEFKHDRRDNLYKLLDVNVRPWGWHALCIACGLDFPYAQYRHALGQPVELSRPRYGRRWRRLITDIPAAIQEVRHDWTTLPACVKSMAGISVGSVFEWRDPLPGLGDTVVCLGRRLGRGKAHAPIQLESPALVSSEV